MAGPPRSSPIPGLGKELFSRYGFTKESVPPGPQREVRFLPHRDLTPGEADTGAVPSWPRGRKGSFPLGMSLNNLQSGHGRTTRRVPKASLAHESSGENGGQAPRFRKTGGRDTELVKKGASLGERIIIKQTAPLKLLTCMFLTSKSDSVRTHS